MMYMVILFEEMSDYIIREGSWMVYVLTNKAYLRLVYATSSATKWPYIRVDVVGLSWLLLSLWDMHELWLFHLFKLVVLYSWLEDSTALREGLVLIHRAHLIGVLVDIVFHQDAVRTHISKTLLMTLGWVYEVISVNRQYCYLELKSHVSQLLWLQVTCKRISFGFDFLLLKGKQHLNVPYLSIIVTTSYSMLTSPHRILLTVQSLILFDSALRSTTHRIDRIIINTMVYAVIDPIILLIWSTYWAVLILIGLLCTQ